MREADIIKLAEQFTRTSTFPKSQVEWLFALIRQTLEHYAQQDHFPVLQTYCNWTLHSQLNNRGHQHILKSIDLSLPDVPQPSQFGPGSGFAEMLVGKALRVRLLKDEMLLFFGRIGADGSFLENEQTFRYFIATMFYSFLGKPIRLRPADYLVSERVDVNRVNSALGRRQRGWFPSAVHWEIGKCLGDFPGDHSCLRCIVTTIHVDGGATIEWSYQVWDLTADPVIDA